MAESTVQHSTDKLLELKEKQKIIDENPFCNLKINDTRELKLVESRRKCDLCQKSRKFFCYTCYQPVLSCRYYPRVKLPIKIDIIKHPREIPGKSTAIHAAIIAPADVKIYIYPDFPEIPNKEETVLVFPSKDNAKNISVKDLFVRKEGKNDALGEKTETVWPIKRAIFIDSTWHQTKSIYKDQRLRELRCVILKSRISQFWRHQKDSPRWYLATIESIHQFLVELHTCALGVDEDYGETIKKYLDLNDIIKNTCYTDSTHQYSVINGEELMQRYNGQYDNLLYFFKYMFEHIHSIYNHNELKAYKRPLI
ncbi:PREDICTED: DTW domain-containing protein 1 [Cyphomyrmex costatus]|uniref:tRNA-uridine aminocarboxypropyltransferase 1 n=1 Tax=Cyphomyrmex costatus TaxID=456900 RepID=A0A195CSY6_9HYME|nr:PREDICTED: DTW domain-containing protein 1 [Cyphomyrmex costatus]KYN03632.1 DTW domain-containing protein 1 [Cyphomyrmex costatus]